METVLHATVGQIVGYLAGAFAVLSVFIEIVPVKINPISSILNWIGERTNKGLFDRVDEIEKKVDAIAETQNEMEERFAEKEAINRRVRILSFSDELRRDVKHSKESFDQALSDIDDYNRYCEEHPKFLNRKTVVAAQRIEEAYHQCLEKDNFL